MIPYFFLIIVLAVYICLLLGVYFGGKKAGFEPAKTVKITLITGFAVGSWIVLLTILGLNDVFKIGGESPPKIIFSILPTVGMIVVLAVLKPIKRFLDTLPQHWIPALQSFRIAVEVALFLLAKNAIAPIEMTFEGWNFDMLVGLSAIGIAIWLAKKPEKARKVAIVWNFIGMAILAVVVVTGLTSALGVIETHPQNTFIGDFPYNLLPGFLVPSAYFLHIMSLRQLYSKSRKIEI